ncbi:hypothetical protein AYI69_g5636 [Smittium culicis]|uniref:Uncharacterized protein n=1 Tax=Smittium culicis TaxID=133412 RepID=A0A1R1Y4Z2_9FUNG|nr:hypothetical protein AYI69_g5636 [Smittium culicis]
MNSGFSQSPGSVDISYSNNDSFSENNKLSQNFGECKYFGIWKVMRFNAIEGSEILIYNSNTCDNLVARKDLCGSYFHNNFMSAFGGFHGYSIKVVAKKNACRYPRKKISCD